LVFSKLTFFLFWSETTADACPINEHWQRC
jgi:hypothetical protein